MSTRYDTKELDLIRNLINRGFIPHQDFKLSEEGKLIIFPETQKKISEKILVHQQQLFSSNKNENAPTSMEAMLEKIAMNACGDHKYFENFFWNAASKIDLYGPNFILAYLEIFAKGTENKFLELKNIPWRNYILNEVIEKTEQVDLLTNLDNSSISPGDTYNRTINDVLIDITLSSSLDFDDEVSNFIEININWTVRSSEGVKEKTDSQAQRDWKCPKLANKQYR
ncbi:MAG: hypothetical protein VKL42_00045 [Snowella sp.]|nr:hypothetical protein [Snowella sp.]